MAQGTGDDEERDVVPSSVPATSPIGITVPVPLVSDRELGIGRVGAHSADAPRAGTLLAGGVPPPESEPPARVTTPVRAILLWSGILVLLVVSLVAAVASLNRDLYSPAGFVRHYLQAITDGRADIALAFPGVKVASAQLEAAGLPAGAADTLLRDDVLRAPADMRFVSDTPAADGHHTVTFSGVVAGERTRFHFDVAPDGTWFGVFHSWRFGTSPIGAVQVSVLHDSSFTVNGLTLDTRAHAAADAAPSFNNSASYLVLTPGVYQFSRDSRLLVAGPQSVGVLAPGVTDVTVDVQASDTFVSEVQTQIDGFLDQCVTQTVLQPTGCPFGTEIDDRVIGDPAWSIVSYPPVTLVPDDTAFQMPPTQGVAHIVVDVQSLFDGSEEPVDRDEPFTMAASVTIGGDNTIEIQLK